MHSYSLSNLKKGLSRQAFLIFVEIMQQTWKTLRKEKPHFTFPFSCIQAENWPGYEPCKCQEESIIKKALQYATI